MIVTLIAFQYVGHVYHLTGMANVASVFVALYFAEKYVDIHQSLKLSPWVLIFVLSVAAWRGSLYLHSHPCLVTSFFRMT